MLDNPVALVAAIIGSAGIGGFFREIFLGLSKLRSGISAKESGRKRDLVTERDYEYDRAEAESRNRRRIEEYASKLRRALVENGLDDVLNELHWPRLEEIPDREPAK